MPNFTTWNPCRAAPIEPAEQRRPRERGQQHDERQTAAQQTVAATREQRADRPHHVAGRKHPGRAERAYRQQAQSTEQGERKQAEAEKLSSPIRRARFHRQAANLSHS